jgi:hypothetical protein
MVYNIWGTELSYTLNHDPKTMPPNYALFDKHLSKIASTTVTQLGSMDNVLKFLQALCDSGNIAFAAKAVTDLISTGIEPIRLHKIIREDRYLAKCVRLALAYAAEIAEGVLYDRAINGYEEISYNKNGECVARKKKYCSKSLLEYLKANSPKYRAAGKSKKEAAGARKKEKAGNMETEIASFEVASYEQEGA